VPAERVADVTSYRVRAKLWDHGWELHVDGVGVTQSHGLTDAKEMARSYIAMMTDAPIDSFEVEIMPEVSGLDLAVHEARAAVREAERAQREAAAQSRALARELRSRGLSGRDIAVVLGVSPQRVSQLLNAPDSGQQAARSA
jgi:hypothetical protein